MRVVCYLQPTLSWIFSSHPLRRMTGVLVSNPTCPESWRIHSPARFRPWGSSRPLPLTLSSCRRWCTYQRHRWHLAKKQTKLKQKNKTKTKKNSSVCCCHRNKYSSTDRRSFDLKFSLNFFRKISIFQHFTINRVFLFIGARIDLPYISILVFQISPGRR